VKKMRFSDGIGVPVDEDIFFTKGSVAAVLPTESAIRGMNRALRR
jgi:hypothetical protein